MGLEDRHSVRVEREAAPPALAIAILLAGEIVDPAERLALTAEGTDGIAPTRSPARSVEHDHVRDLMRAAANAPRTCSSRTSTCTAQIVEALIERGSLDAEEINQLQEERQLAE